MAAEVLRRGRVVHLHCLIAITVQIGRVVVGIVKEYLVVRCGGRRPVVGVHWNEIERTLRRGRITDVITGNLHALFVVGRAQSGLHVENVVVDERAYCTSALLRDHALVTVDGHVGGHVGGRRQLQRVKW